MKPFKGTFAVQMVLAQLWHSALTLCLALLMLFAMSGKAFAQPSQRPLFLSFEKRLILTYLLAGAGEPEEVQIQMANRLQKMIRRYFETPAKEAVIRSFPEFLQIYKGPWPDSYSVKSDLELIEGESFRGPVIYRAVNDKGLDNPALQSQIEGFILSQNQQMLEKVNLQQAPMATLGPMADLLLKSENLGDQRAWILRGFGKATELLQRQMQFLEKVGEQVAKSGKLSQLDPSTRLFLETVLQEYFARLGLSSKKQLVSRFLGQSLTADPMDRFESMLMGAGPQFQKLLQIIAGNSSVSADLGKTLKKLESKVSPIPAPIVKKLFEAERHRYQWIHYDLEPLGTGTMAQVHRGIIHTTDGDEDVVIRFLKPEIENRVREDARILKEIAVIMDADERFEKAGFPKLAPLVEDLNKTVTDELNLQDTIQRQKLGRTVYNRTILVNMKTYKNYLRINVPNVIDGGPDSKLMVQELVHGRKLDQETLSYRESVPAMARVLSEQLASLWTEEVLFGSGFFHSDLHQGNYLVNVTDPEIILSPLDFGMGGVISKEMQRQLALLAIGLELNRDELVTRALWALSLPDHNQTSAVEFAEKVNHRMQKIRQGAVLDVELSQWMTWAMNQGLRFPYELISLNRGMVILDQALKEVGSPYSISTLAKKIAPLRGRSLIMDLKSKGLITSRDLMSLGMMALLGQNDVIQALPLPQGPLQCSKIYLRRARPATAAGH